jgi:ABC-type sugar transport system substrate-binding protein
VRRALVAALVVAATLAASAAATVDAPGTGVVLKGLDNPFFVAMFHGVTDRAKSLRTPVTVQAATSITDTAGQAARLRALAARRYRCYVVNPITQTNLIAALRRVKQPIVNIDNPIDRAAARKAGIAIATYIGTDNVAAGKLAAREMRALVSSGGEVAMVGGRAGDVTSGNRLSGFAAGIAGTNLHVVQRVAANWDRTTAVLAATAILRKHPALKGFFAANDIMALGVAQAVRTAGRPGSVAIIGVDGIEEALSAVRSGALSATVSQYPYTIGSMGVEACAAAARGARLPAHVDAPLQLVTKANVDRAIANFPRPVSTYADPFTRLVGP